MIQANSLEGTVTIEGIAPMVATELCMIMEVITSEIDSDTIEDTQECMKDIIKSLGKEQMLYEFLQFLEPIIK